ncbi:GtrA family protein [Pilimelia columellifera]
MRAAVDQLPPDGSDLPGLDRRRGPFALARMLWARVEHLAHEMGKFGIVGISAFAVDSALFAILLSNRMEPLTAKTLSTAVSATLAFLGNRFWTWAHRERSGLAREYGLYFLFNVIGLGIAVAALGLSYYGLGPIWPVFQTPLANFVAANIVGTGAGTLFRFWSYRRFVFVEAQMPQVAAASAENNY